MKNKKIILAIVGLILNIMLIPGIGTLVTKRFKIGIIQLVLALIGIITIIVFIGIFIYLAVWIWALVDSIIYLVNVINENTKEESSDENKEQKTN